MSRRNALVLVGLLAFVASIGLAVKASAGESGGAAVSSTKPDLRVARSSPDQPWAEIVSRKRAEEVVRRAVVARESAPTFSLLMTWSMASSLFNLDRTQTAKATRLIWLVTVKTRVRSDGGPATAPELKRFYSAVVDARTGRITDDCIGCAWLRKSA